MRAQGGYASQGRVVNRPRPIPVQAPQNSYGPPKKTYGPPAPPQNSYGPPHAAGGHSSGSGSLHAFAHSHSPGVSCEGWIPIPGPSIGIGNSASGAASIGASIDTSYGPPHSSGHGSQGTLIVVPEDSYGPPPPVNPQPSYGTPSISSGGHAASVSSIDTSYGVPAPPVSPQSSYGTPSFSSGGHAASISSIDTSYGVPPPPVNPQSSYGPPQISSGGHASVGAIDTSYGVPPPPVNPQSSYGPPQISSGGHAASIGSIDTSYGVPPPPVNPQSSYGIPSGTPDIPPAPIPVIIGSGHASNAVALEQTYGPPPKPDYLPPAPQVNIISSGHSSSANVGTRYEAAEPVGHQEYGVPANFGPPESSYGPPPSGSVHFEDSRQGHAVDIHTVQSVSSDLQLPEVDNLQFNNDINIGTTALGVSAGNSELIKSHAVHESHTSEVSIKKLKKTFHYHTLFCT